ncbi:hypothetical protein BSKO_05013 [Bryopsis sp. KO-2023]|nr:hypothetical protein BSKO_05013 [Bryopsis sp. KO-2023]
MGSSLQAAVTGYAAILLLLSSAQIAWGRNAFLDAATVKLDADGNPISLLGEKVVERIGSTPPEVVIDKVVAFPVAGGQDSIVLRNIGGQTAIVNGWTLTDGTGTEFVFDPSTQCPQFDSIAPGEALKLAPNSDGNPCGFDFNLSFQ